LANDKGRIIDYAIRTGAPMEVVENLQAIEDEGEIYDLLRKYGVTTLLMRISFGTRTNINKAISFTA
jgi:hypothetical protein